MPGLIPERAVGGHRHDLPGTEDLDDLSPEWAWGGARGEGVRAAVIDSGIDADHPDLEGCVDVDAGVHVAVTP